VAAVFVRFIFFSQCFARSLHGKTSQISVSSAKLAIERRKKNQAILRLLLQLLLNARISIEGTKVLFNQLTFRLLL